MGIAFRVNIKLAYRKIVITGLDIRKALDRCKNNSLLQILSGGNPSFRFPEYRGYLNGEIEFMVCNRESLGILLEYLHQESGGTLKGKVTIEIL